MAVDVVVYDKVDKESEKIQDALYALYPQQTITDAAIASFSDGSDGIPVKELVVGVEPVQDLHGYDAPYPSGGSKNKLPLPVANTVTGLTLVRNSDGSVTITGTATENTYFDFFSGDFDSTAFAGHRFVASVTNRPSSGVSFRVSGSNRVSLQEFNNDGTIADNGTGLYFGIRISSGVAISGGGMNIKPMIISPSETDTFTPYSNICPISGWTGCEVARDGANLIDDTATPSGFFKLLPKGTYYVKRFPITTNNQINSKLDALIDNVWTVINTTGTLDNGNITITGSLGWGASPEQIITLSKPYMIRLSVSTINGFKNDAHLMMAVGGVPSAYSPYQSKEISVTFPASAGTVYGGYINLITGVLTVDTRYIVADGVNIKCTGGYAGGASRVPGIDISSQSSDASKWDLLVTSYLKAVRYADAERNSVCLFNGGSWIALHINDIQGIGSGTPYPTDADLQTAANAYLQDNPLQIAYPLATPVTYQLDPITLNTLCGTNNIWADCGSIQKLTYRADLGKYIDSHITTAVANALNA